MTIKKSFPFGARSDGNELYFKDNMMLPRAKMKFFIRKPDMDTVLTALLLGWQESVSIEVVGDHAPAEALADSQVYCIECGGSGEVERGNFDHHNTALPLPPACLQAYQWLKLTDVHLWTLVCYVAAVDQGSGQSATLPEKDRLTLSGLFSGMRLVHGSTVGQFQGGMEIFRTILNLGLDPWGPMPDLPQWREYAAAKRAQQRHLGELTPLVEFFQTRSGLQGGYLEASCPGVHGLLRKLGCELSIAWGLAALGLNDKPLVTIAGREINLTPLLAILNRAEKGWGGAGPWPNHRLPRVRQHFGQRAIDTTCNGRNLIMESGFIIKADGTWENLDSSPTTLEDVNAWLQCDDEAGKRVWLDSNLAENMRRYAIREGLKHFGPQKKTAPDDDDGETNHQDQSSDKLLSIGIYKVAKWLKVPAGYLFWEEMEDISRSITWEYIRWVKSNKTPDDLKKGVGGFISMIKASLPYRLIDVLNEYRETCSIDEPIGGDDNDFTETKVDRIPSRTLTPEEELLVKDFLNHCYKLATGMLREFKETFLTTLQRGLRQRLELLEEAAEEHNALEIIFFLEENCHNKRYLDFARDRLGERFNQTVWNSYNRRIKEGWQSFLASHPKQNSISDLTECKKCLYQHICEE